MKKITSEMIGLAKKARSVEELITLAKEYELELTEEEAKKYFEQLHPNSGELSDDVLDKVAGGWCYDGGRPVITVGEQHSCYVCSQCGKTQAESFKSVFLYSHRCNNGNLSVNYCGDCKYIIYTKGKWLCNNPANRG
ncbi:MAG: DUF2624 family protein [Ruminococcaceae bacterium]|nr:DUF2624 family protein [Oscillospiraceae bacterium]